MQEMAPIMMVILKQAKEKLKESAQAADQGFFLRRRQGSLKELRNQFERMLILDRLSIPHQSKSEVAISLGITYRSLASKCKSLDI